MTDTLALHLGLLTLDTHIDIPWPDGPAFTDDGARHVDLPKMRRGHLAGACFAAYAPQGPRTAEGYQAAFARAAAMLVAIAAMGGEACRVCGSADAVEAAHRAGLTAIVPAVENGYACGEDPAALAHCTGSAPATSPSPTTATTRSATAPIPRPDLGDAPSRARRAVAARAADDRRN